LAVDARVRFCFDVGGEASLAAIVEDDSAPLSLALAAAIAVIAPILRFFPPPITILDFYPEGYDRFISSSG